MAFFEYLKTHGRGAFLFQGDSTPATPTTREIWQLITVFLQPTFIFKCYFFVNFPVEKEMANCKSRNLKSLWDTIAKYPDQIKYRAKRIYPETKV
jgi:hypothetical protein